MYLCIYHGHCSDGFMAAVIVRRAIPNCSFHHGVHGEAPPVVAGLHVILVDFSYKRDILLGMAKTAASILILDHHKSAEAELHDLPDNVTAHFDMDRSGAMMTWNHYFPNTTAPKIVQHVQDRDLWRFKLKGTREIIAALFSWPYEFDLWSTFLDSDDCSQLERDGVAIERKQHKDVGELLKLTARRMLIGKFSVPVANLPYTLTSETAHIMAQGELFAACYWDTSAVRIFGLRSDAEGMDVSWIAQQYGGGGHKHAAGFSVPRDHTLATS